MAAATLLDSYYKWFFLELLAGKNSSAGARNK